ncbi:MAG: P-II family nitrogen regulator [Clostridiales bacterium]
MKKAIIVIRPNKYQETKKALEAIGFNALSTTLVRGRGKLPLKYNVADFKFKRNYNMYNSFMSKRMIMLYIRDEDESLIIDTIMKVNSSGNCGDGKIFILPITKCVRVRTDEIDESALV